ncbi:helix-turn-helix domain-containing protein, partial [Limnobacter sp. MED105]|uniref:AlbA family DNA-binding domain-containing protein n=1 Tax=Limnobacter sp. MED105 TaxID=391597 RepID=UPI000156C062
EALRQSQDEEVIADIVAWISADKGLRSSSDILNQLYNFNVDGNEETSISNTIEIQIQKVNEDVIISNIQFVFDEIMKIVNHSGKTFNSLLFENQQAKISRYFQVVFYALYKLLVEEEKVIADIKKLVGLLDGAGDKIISLAAGGGNWSAKEKQTQSDALYGVISRCFEKSSINDPARNQWVTRFENILMQSSTEQTLYDFKVGVHTLNEAEDELDKETFSKIIKTLTSMANTFPNSVGYCLLGVADNKNTAERYKKIYGNDYVSYSTFHITGIESEAKRFYGDIDKYFTKIVQLIKTEPISDRDKDNISRNITTVRYFEKSVIIMKIESDSKPSVYDNKYFVRHGSNIDEVLPQNFG